MTLHLAEERRQTLKVLSCAAVAGLATLDTFELVDHAVQRDGLRALYLDSHHTPSGNRLIARSIVSTNWLPTLPRHPDSRAMHAP